MVKISVADRAISKETFVVYVIFECVLSHNLNEEVKIHGYAIPQAILELLCQSDNQHVAELAQIINTESQGGIFF